MYYGAMPNVWCTSVNSTLTLKTPGYRRDSFTQQYAATFRTQYKQSGAWVSYDVKYINPYYNEGYPAGNPGELPIEGVSLSYRLRPNSTGTVVVNSSGFFDPRTGRFGPTLWFSPPDPAAPAPFTNGWLNATLKANLGATSTEWVKTTQVVPSLRLYTSYNEGSAFLTSGWHQQTEANGNCDLNGDLADRTCPGFATVNSPLFTIRGAAAQLYYEDADGVVRRAMGAYAPPPSSSNAPSAVGLPMLTASTYPGQTASSTAQVQSRPLILNRPFRSVGELGHVFSGTPWKNLDFFTPESGDAGLLDLFTTSETGTSGGMVAGKIYLNTRQKGALTAVLAGAFKDEQAGYPSPPTWKLAPLTTADAAKIAAALIARTSNATDPAKGPLRNLSELVGRYTAVSNAYGQPYDGFSNDLTSIFGNGTAAANIQRFREAPIRALAATGQTRVWNLMIDVIAQSGRYPISAVSPSQFVVEGERRYWVHLAIDRLTGQVIDSQIEIVAE